MPPVECTSLGSGAEAPHYLALALSPLVEDYHFLDYQPMMYQREILLTSAALPDSPNPLNPTMNYDSPDSYTHGFSFDPHYNHTNDNLYQNNFIESETSNIYKSSCDVLEGKDISNMALQSTANNKELPLELLDMETEHNGYIKKEPTSNGWPRSDIVNWLVNGYRAEREQVERLPFNNSSDLLSMLNSNIEEYAEILGMATTTLREACKSIDNSTHPDIMPPGHVYVNGNHNMMHPVKQESNSQLEYPPAWGEQASYTGHPCEYTSEEDLEEEPEKQVEVPKRTGKRGRPPSATSKAAAKRKEKGHGKLWEFIRDLLKEPKYCPSLICWEDHDHGVFRFVSSEKVAKLWGDKRKNNAMNYEKLSRAMRYYYKSKILQPVTHRRLVYKFGPNAVHWRCENPNFIQKS